MFIRFKVLFIFLLTIISMWMFTPINASARGIKVKLKASENVNAPVVGEVNLYAESYALVIGINNYTQGWPRLSGAVNDAKLVAEELRKKGFNVTLETNLDSRTLKQTFEEFFILKGNHPQARLFVWFAGHGHTLNGEGFLIPTDAPLPHKGARFRLKALSMRRFGEYVRLAQSKHALAVFDSCFSGTIFDTQRTAPPPAITRATTLPVRQFLTSGDTDQKVSDDGRFRKLFIRAIRGEERADANQDGYVTGSELGLFLTDRVTNLTRSRQTPRYGKLRDEDYDRGDFVFLLASSSAIIEKPSLETSVGFKIPKVLLTTFEVPQYSGFWHYSNDVKMTKGQNGDVGAPLPLCFEMSINNPNSYPVKVSKLNFTVSFDGIDLIDINRRISNWIPAKTTDFIKVNSLFFADSGLANHLTEQHLRQKGKSSWQVLENWWTGVPLYKVPVEMKKGSVIFNANSINKEASFSSKLTPTDVRKIITTNGQKEKITRSQHFKHYIDFKAPKISLVRFDVPNERQFWYASRKVESTHGISDNRGASMPLRFILAILNPNPYSICLKDLRFTVVFDNIELMTVKFQESNWIPSNKEDQFEFNTILNVRSVLTNLLVNKGFHLQEKRVSAWGIMEEWWTNVNRRKVTPDLEDGTATFLVGGQTRFIPFKFISHH